MSRGFALTSDLSFGAAFVRSIAWSGSGSRPKRRRSI